MSYKYISEIIEKLAIESVMTEAEDTETLNEMHRLFTEMHTWAEASGESHLREGAGQCILLSSGLASGKITEPDKSLNLLKKTISAIQQHSRNQYDFSKIAFPNELFAKETEAVTEKSPPEKSDTVNADRLHHPGILPDYLGTGMFLEFLAVQDSVINKMESIILRIESENDQAGIVELKRLVHSTKGEAGFLNLQDVEKICHHMEDLLEHERPDIFSDIFFNAIDWLRNTFKWYAGQGSRPAPVETVIESISSTAMSTDPRRANRIETKQQKENYKKPGEESAKISGEIIKESLAIKEFINVDTERLDKLIDMIGELVIAESMIMQSDEIRKIKSQKFSQYLNHMNKITRTLQETGLSLRMTPIRNTFRKMARIARDTAKKAGKNVNFRMSGEETELDKSVIDKLGDPLLHMIRNAIDHGIENTTDERISKKKSETATVSIKAFHKGGNIHIQIEDDGKGLDKDKILKTAIKKGLVAKNATLPEQEIHSLIFEPGFSTAQKLTDISGRGVGMNVVRNMLEKINGQIEIKSSPGEGCVFTIKIPLTLAIIDGMIVGLNNDRFIIPTLSIITSDRMDNNRTTGILNKEKVIDVQGQLVPICSLRRILSGSQTEKGEENLVVIVEENGKKAAILVDELLGRQQIVIKTLGENMKNIKGISGGAILADGRVGLILDIADIVSGLNKLPQPLLSPS